MMTRLHRLTFLLMITIIAYGQVSKIYQAEEAEFYHAKIEAEHSGFTGDGYVNFNNEAGSYIDFTIFMAKSDSQTMTMTYANGSFNARPMTVMVNDVAQPTTPQFLFTGGWSLWSSDSLKIPFNEGINRVRLLSNAEEGGPNLDKILVAGEPGTAIYQLSIITIGFGSVVLDPAEIFYKENTTVELTAVADSGWFFLEWRGDTTARINPLVLSVRKNIEMTAVFAAHFDSIFQWKNKPIGFATVDSMGQKGTIGGAGGDTIIIETGSQLNEIMVARKDAHFNQNHPPRILWVQGKLTWTEKKMMDVKETYDLSIIGEGNNAIIEGFGLNLYRSHNIIIQNLEFRDCPDDGINIQDEKSHHIWVDHCAFSDGDQQDPEGKNHDGLLDIKQGASFIEVSWCHFYNHQKTNLIGHSDNNGIQDTGRLKVSYHHNWWENTGSRHPRVRFGDVHVFNNYYDNSDGKMGYGIASTMEANVVVESNYFYHLPQPTHCGYAASAEGDLVEFNNIYDDCGVPETRGTVFNPADYYICPIDHPVTLPGLLTTFTGPGKIHPMTPTSIDGQPTQRPLTFVLNQNFPNPFNPETTISFTLTKNGKAHLAVYDLKGRKVATLFNKHTQAGNYKVSFSAHGLADGIYLYRLQCDEQFQTGKMMLLK